MIRILLIGALVCLAAPAASAQSVAGDWQGTLSSGGTELHVVLHVRADGGKLNATLDSVDQGANGIPVTAIALEHAKLTLRLDSINGTYEGTLNAAGTEINGIWSQGVPIELNFRRVKAEEKGRQGNR